MLSIDSLYMNTSIVYAHVQAVCEFPLHKNIRAIAEYLYLDL